MFENVLIANRGEIALRILRACRELGLETIALYSTADSRQRNVELADRSLCIGSGPAAESYLDIKRVIQAAKLMGAQAIHPGYGFLAESAAFAKAVETAGMIFIGPSAALIAQLGDKLAAKHAMRTAGIPCVPGSDDVLDGDSEEIAALAQRVGYPVIVKAAGGGGGRGMRVVRGVQELVAAIETTRAEAGRTFDNEAVYLEKYLECPRHIEFQILADGHGNAVWLGERDCSLQRRHQKLIEEAPAISISRSAIKEIGDQCAATCRAIGYTGAGTFEFLYQDGAFYFIEMNTRLQVEHPVTEMTCGIDIVREHIQIARGYALSFGQDDLGLNGHAIECRINAEDPKSMLPSPGIVTRWTPPGGPGIRVESHLRAGTEVPPYYDSLIAKFIAHGPDRKTAIARMLGALNETEVEGVTTNIPLLRRLLQEDGIARGGYTIHHLQALIGCGWLDGVRGDT